MNELTREQKRWIELLQKEETDYGADILNLDSLKKLAEVCRKRKEREEKLVRLRKNIQDILAIRSVTTLHEAELQRYQAKLAVCDDDALLALEEDGTLEHYRKLLSCIRAEDPDRKAVSSIAEYFGFQLAYALLQKELVLSQAPVSEVWEPEELEPVRPESEPQASETTHAESKPLPPKATDAEPEPPVLETAPEEPKSEAPEAAPPVPPEPDAPKPSAAPKKKKKVLKTFSMNAAKRRLEPSVRLPDPLDEGPFLTAAAPVKKKEGSAGAFKSDLRKLSAEARIILPLLSQFGVISQEIIRRIGRATEWDEFCPDTDTFAGRISTAFSRLTERGLAAEYQTAPYGSIYCLTEYGYACMHKASIMEKAGELFYIRCEKRLLHLSIGNHRLLGKTQVNEAILLDTMKRNLEIADYLCCLRKHQDALRLTKYLLGSIVCSLTWKADSYVIKIIPAPKHEIFCRIYHGDSITDYENGAALFLAKSAPAVPSSAKAGQLFFCDGEWFYIWKQGWESIPSKDGEPLDEADQANGPGTEDEPDFEANGAPEPKPAPISVPEASSPAAEPESSASAAPVPSTTEELEIGMGTDTIPQNAKKLLRQPEQIRPDHLLLLTVQLLAEDRFAEATELAKVLAHAPKATNAVCGFYLTFRQSIRVPGRPYHYSSNLINTQQNMLPEGDTPLRGLQQVMVLSTLLWAMAFPTEPYDHNLYNHARMAVSGGLGGKLDDIIQKLIALLGTDLKELSNRNDGLGFSQRVLDSLVNDGKRERILQQLCTQADGLRNTPTSTVGISGLEECLKRMVGPASQIGSAIASVAANDISKARTIRDALAAELPNGDSDNQLEAYIDQCWTDLRRSDPSITLKHLDNDSRAQRTCKKALTDRLPVIRSWLEIADSEQESSLEASREQYIRIRNQLKTLLEALVQEPASGQDPYRLAGRNILRRTAKEMLSVLDGSLPDDGKRFYYDLCLSPGLMLNEKGEVVIVKELYDVRGLEPWIPLLRAAAQDRAAPEAILSQIEDYQSADWYRNYGTEALLYRFRGEEPPDRSAGIQNAERLAEQEIQEFMSDVRLWRAYGKLQEQSMQTAFSVLALVRQVYFRMHNYAGFNSFLGQLRALLDQEIVQRAARYEKRVQELEADPRYAGAAMLHVIRKALENRNFNSVDSYINRLQSGDMELPAADRGLKQREDFLAQFQAGEEVYYLECFKHRSDSPANWGESVLGGIESGYQHWTSPNEKKKGCTWLSRWIKGRSASDTALRVKDLLEGLGFQVKNVVKDDTVKPSAMYELYRVSAEKTSTGLKDYPHPVYKFGTDLSDPMYVVCLYGCKGASTLIQVMTGELQLEGPTIVLMDGTLTVADRCSVAEKFKSDTSGQSPFLLIDRVLMLYLASLDEGNRKKAMLRCTLPYTFEVLYGSGSGAVPEEMFIGRVSEINDLRSDQGPSLVYGGRQLGKTALLNRASKTLHDPENGSYSFCVDIKDEGGAALLERVCRKLQKLNLLQAPCPSFDALCGELQNAYDEQKIRRLRIFVDESDRLFEEFQQDKYEALRPFIILRDNTSHHIKFVFAGTHNIAATDSAEEENSNLLHMGRPLCIEPLSTDDATRLIRIPMSYLGFEIGGQQIELILSNTNSYPGLIHIFCSALIQSVCRDYDRYYGSSWQTGNPPFRISDEQMRAVFKEKDIRKEIGTRVMSTIRLNRKYRVVSYLLAHMSYEDQENGRSRLYGYSTRDLLSYNEREFQIRLLRSMTEKNLTALLDEMVRMGILWKNEETRQYRFRQQDFLGYIGSDEQVMESLLAEGMEDQA